MISSKKPTAKQKRFHQWIKSQYCPINGQSVELHHCVGSTAKHDKIHIGQDFVIPLSFEAHRGGHGIHGDRSLFDKNLGDRRIQIEKGLFKKYYLKWLDEGGHRISQDVLDAIKNYSR